MTMHIVAGKYALLKKIAVGGMAEVYLAKQIGFNGFEKLVVLKRILPQFSENEDYVRMFLDEARTAADLRHSNVAHTFEVGQDQGIYFLVMEYLSGQDLRSIQKKINAGALELPLQYLVGIIKDVAAGLHYAHTKRDLKGQKLGIVHRDISPQNIIVTYDGETKIVDFGIAKAATQSRETVSGVLKGKYSYMAPEQASGEAIDHRTDLFSLAIILYELATKNRLFKRQNDMQTLRAVIDRDIAPPSSLVPDFPKELESIVMKALSKNAGDRYADCGQFRMALEEFLVQAGVAHSPPRLGELLRASFKEQLRSEDEVIRAQVAKKTAPMPPASSQTNPSQSSLKGSRDQDALKQTPSSGNEDSVVSTVSNIFGLNHRAQIAIVSVLGGGLGIIFVFYLLHAISGGEPANQKGALSPGNEVRSTLHIPQSQKQEFAGLAKTQPQPRIAAPKTPARVEKVGAGRLKVVVQPWANVYLDGIRIGSTPLAAKKLPPGKYVVKLENPALKKKIRKEVHIIDGQDTMLRYDFSKENS